MTDTKELRELEAKIKLLEKQRIILSNENCVNRITLAGVTKSRDGSHRAIREFINSTREGEIKKIKAQARQEGRMSVYSDMKNLTEAEGEEWIQNTFDKIRHEAREILQKEFDVKSEQLRKEVRKECIEEIRDKATTLAIDTSDKGDKLWLGHLDSVLDRLTDSLSSRGLSSEEGKKSKGEKEMNKEEMEILKNLHDGNLTFLKKCDLPTPFDFSVFVVDGFKYSILCLGIEEKKK